MRVSVDTKNHSIANHFNRYTMAFLSRNASRIMGKLLNHALSRLFADLSP